MWLGVLGPLRVDDGGGAEVIVRAAKQRVVLAALLLHANHTISFDEIAAALWEGPPAPGARMTVRNYVRRLRQVLGPEIGARIRTRDPGYMFQAGEGELDLLRFARLCQDGGSAVRAGDWMLAWDALEEALGLWRGTPLADVPSTMLQRDEVPPLDQARLQALEWRADAALHLGRHADVASELESLSAKYPLRERFHAQLMLVLYRCGRQAHALAAYARAREVLVRELGVEPGPELRQLHDRVLRADPDLLSAAGHAGGRGDDREVPRQLPADTAHFAGRTAELSQLDGMPGASGNDAAAQVIAVISGPPGVGKTTLAVHWGHQVAERFPDGQLYANLRGFDPAGMPVAPGQAIRGFLDALGIPAAGLPADTEEQASLYRSLLAGQRVLVVLDNARDEQQVRLLLPGGPGAVAVITSRHPLAGLVASPGAWPITLDVLTDDDSRELLARRLGRERLAAEPTAVPELIGYCANLPLALAITAARAATNSRLSLAGLSAGLRDSRRRLDALELTDTSVSVRHIFASSYDALSDDAARMFRLLGISPGPEISTAAAASLAACGQRRAGTLLRELTQVNLLTERTAGRYTFHDLLGAYAAELASTHDSDSDRQAALDRLLGYLLHAAIGAALALHPRQLPMTLVPPRPGVEFEVFSDDTQALTWLESEYAVLLAAIRRAEQEKLDAYVWQLSWGLTDLFAQQQGRWHDWVTVQRGAVAAARRSGDHTGQAIALRGLGQATATLGNYHLARTYLDDAIEHYRELRNVAGEAQLHGDLCVMCGLQGEYAEALRHALRALDIARDAGLPEQANALNSIGWCHAQLGEYQQALASCEQALALHCTLSNTFGEATTLDSLGYVHHRLGHYARAISYYQRAHDLHARLGSRWQQTQTLDRLGDTRLAMGDQAAAARAWGEALAILDDLQHPDAASLRQKLSDLQSAKALRTQGNA